MAETSLYPPIKRFLEARGFEVKGEVAGTDVVGLRDGEPPLLVMAELKLGLSFELVLQAVERLRCADEVWLAVPATRRGRDRDRRAHRLCRLLGLGLLAVTLRTGHVEVIAEPGPYAPRRNLPQRRRTLREFAGRRGDPTEGGGRGKVMTAYRQQSLAIAAALAAGPGRPRELRAEAPEAAAILQRNVYGWFERRARGVYGLSEAGLAALGDWAEHLPKGACDGLSRSDG